jgi:hypothetical protein
MESDPSIVDYVKSLHGIMEDGDVETAAGNESEGDAEQATGPERWGRNRGRLVEFVLVC